MLCLLVRLMQIILLSSIINMLLTITCINRSNGHVWSPGTYKFHRTLPTLDHGTQSKEHLAEVKQ